MFVLTTTKKKNIKTKKQCQQQRKSEMFQNIQVPMLALFSLFVRSLRWDTEYDSSGRSGWVCVGEGGGGGTHKKMIVLIVGNL